MTTSRLAPDCDGYVSFGTVARTFIGMQCQYASRYITGLAGSPVLCDGLRFRNLEQDYHDYRVHVDDVPACVDRILHYRAELAGMSVDDLRREHDLPSAEEVARRSRPLNRKEAAALAENLYEMQKPLNGGRGVSAVRQVAQSLVGGDIEAARAVYDNDGDKIRNYPEIDSLLAEELGSFLDM